MTVIPSETKWSRGIPQRYGKLISSSSFDFAQDDAV